MWLGDSRQINGHGEASYGDVNSNLPTVSVIIPAKTAAETLPLALASIAKQEYANIIDVVVAAADNNTSDVAKAAGTTVVMNPEGSTPVGLNLAIAKSKGEVIVRCDAHSQLPPDYVGRSIATLLRTGADNVGGMQVPIGETFWERAIAGAMSSPLGAGDARYRIGGKEGPVETVYLGVFRRSKLDELRGFDERFERNQDYELNHRIIATGGVVWFDPALKVRYRPRGSLGALFRQYFDYGRWKRQASKLHRRSLRWRQMAPPVLVLALAGSVVLTNWVAWAWLLPATYGVTLVIGGLVSARATGWSAMGIPPTLAIMHLAWGVGFLRG